MCCNFQHGLSHTSCSQRVGENRRTSWLLNFPPKMCRYDLGLIFLKTFILPIKYSPLCLRINVCLCVCLCFDSDDL